MKKRILSLALALVMIISLLPATTFAADFAVSVWFHNTSDALKFSQNPSDTPVYYTTVDGSVALWTGEVPPEKNYIKVLYTNTTEPHVEVTLNEITMESLRTSGGSNAAIYFPYNTGKDYAITIRLIGENKITSGTNACIRVAGKLGTTITGDGSLTLTGSNPDGVILQNNSGDLTIKDTTVNITNEKGGWYHAIFANSAGTDVIIDGADLTTEGAIFFGTGRSNTDTTNTHNVSIINGSNVRAAISAQSGLGAIHCSGTTTIKDSNVIAYTTLNGARAFRLAPELQGNYTAYYSTSTSGKLTSPKDFDLEPGTALTSGTHNYVEITHICIDKDDDANCTTATICGCGKEIIAAYADHIAEEDDNNCATPTKCINCDMAVVPGFAHTPMDPVIENDTEDSYDSVTYCSVCGKEASRETISKLCPHTNNTFLSKEDATCTEDGAEHYYCSDCEENYDVVLPATGHNYVAGEPVAPTYYAQGYTLYTCGNCSDSYKDNIVYKLPSEARIDKVRYGTLQEAIDAAAAGNTVTLTKSVNAAEAIVVDKDVIIDLCGFTYTVSSAKEASAFVVKAGATVTLTSSGATSKLQTRYDAREQFNYLVKNEGSLVVKNVILSGNNLFNADSYVITNSGRLVLKDGAQVRLSKNAIGLSNTGSALKAADIELDAAEGYHWNKAGELEAHSYTPTEVPATVYEVSHTLHQCVCGDSYKTDFGDKKLSVVAKNVNTGILYATVQEAVDAATAGDTIKLNKKVTLGKAIVVDKDLTIDFNGFVYTVCEPADGATLVIKSGANVSLISSGATAKLQVRYTARDQFNYIVRNEGSLTVENVILYGNNLYNLDSYAVVNSGSLTLNDDAKITVREKDSTVQKLTGSGEVADNSAVNAPLASASQLENVTMSKTSSAGDAVTVHPGSKITYTISLTNNNADAISVNVTDTLPKGTTFVEGCDSVDGKELFWVEKNIAPGETRTITYTVKNHYTIEQVRAAETDIVIKNSAFKVIDTAVDAACDYIWVLETFNKEDIRKMEMAIDAMVTANVSVTNAKNGPLYPIAMMYNVGFTVGAGFGTTDPDEVLTMIYEQAGQGGDSSSGGVEDVVDTASNLLDRVVPTFYGGTAVPAEKDSLFRGIRATEVTIDKLISGDVIVANKDGVTDLYLVDGQHLVKLEKTAITRKIDPATVLPGLPTSDKYVVIRPSINLNITFSLNEGECFNDADKNGYTDVEKALIATAESYLLRGDRTQYTDDSTGTSTNRAENSIKQPEDYTVDQYGYTNCAYFTHDVHWATLGFAPQGKQTDGSTKPLSVTNYNASFAKRYWDTETQTSSNAAVVFYCEPMVKDSNGTYASTLDDVAKDALKKQIVSMLRPGDIINIRRTTGSGHAMLYVGNGTIIHSSGSNYSNTNKTDTHEASIRFRMVEDLFDPAIYNETSCVFNLASFSILRLQNLKTSPAATENTQNRVNNMQGIIAEKVTSTAMGQTVNCGDEITYTFHIFNTNAEAKTFAINDVISEYTTFVSATNGGTVDGSNISWNITVPADTRISVSYTVKVNEGVAAYTAIDGTKATVGGVMHRCPNTYVANTLTTEQQQALVAAVETVKAMDVSALNSVEIAELIYKTAFGVDDLFGEEVTNYSMLLDGGNNQSDSSLVKGTDNVGVFNDTWYWESSNKTTVALMNYNTSKPAMMVAPGMWGGQLVMNSTYNKNGRDETFTRYLNVSGGVLRSRYFWEKDLVVGDIFLMKASTQESMYLYIGNDTFVSIGAGHTLFSEQSVSDRFQYAPATTWKKLAVLRPSIVLDI